MDRTRQLLVAVVGTAVMLVAGGSPASAAEPMPDHATVWAVGDSITAGVGTGHPKIYSYPARLRELGLQVQAIGTPGQCLVVSGCHHTAPMLETVKSVLSRARPGDVLVLEAGVNDLGRATVPQLKRGYRAVVRAGEASGIQVVVATIAPRGTRLGWPAALPERQRVQVNAWLRSRGWVVADTDVRLATHIGGPLAPWFDSGDGLHPNAVGARAMAHVVARVLHGL